MTTNPELLAQSYEAAADYIDRFGWHQGNLVKGHVPTSSDSGLTTIHDIRAYIDTVHPPVCAMGAGYAVGACGASASSPFVDIDVVEWMSPLEDATDGHLPTWNDNAHRTKEEVTDLLRLVASKIRMGNIGDNPREYEFEPFPESEPAVEPAAPQPAPEKVPA